MAGFMQEELIKALRDCDERLAEKLVRAGADAEAAAESLFQKNGYGSMDELYMLEKIGAGFLKKEFGGVKFDKLVYFFEVNDYLKLMEAGIPAGDIISRAHNIRYFGRQNTAEAELKRFIHAAGVRKADMNIKNTEGNTLIFTCALGLRMECVKELAGFGANPDMACRDGNTALTELAFTTRGVMSSNVDADTFTAKGRLDMAAVLLELGACPDVEGVYGLSPLDIAAPGEFRELLIKYGARQKPLSAKFIHLSTGSKDTAAIRKFLYKNLPLKNIK
jgi:hypothetical protein